MSAEVEVVSPLSFTDIDRICRSARILKVAVCSGCGQTVYGGIHLPMIAYGIYCAACCPCQSVSLTSGELAAIKTNRRNALAQRKSMAESARSRWADPEYRRRVIAKRAVFWAARRKERGERR